MINEMKINIKKLSWAFVVCFSVAISSFAQQGNTLFYMHKVPQSNSVNPAIISECKVHVGGALIPVTGQLFFPIYTNYGNNSFGYNNLFFYGTGDYSDSLVTPFHPNAYESGASAEFFERLKRNNYINFENHINLLNVGVRVKDIYFNFNVNEKMDMRFWFTKDFLEFANNLNGNAYGRRLDMGFGLQAKHYREYSLSAATKLTDKVQAGARIKLLYGKANLHTKENRISLKTDPIDWGWDMETDMQFSTSSPFFNILQFDYDIENDSMIFEMDTTLEMDPVAYIMNRKNFGFGIDLGGIYDLTDQLKIHASLIDVGFIRWRDNPVTLKSSGEFKFNGINFVPYLIEPDVRHDSVLTDSIIGIFEPEFSSDPYNTWLTAKLHLGATYQLHEKLGVGFLYRSEIYRKGVHPSMILSANSNITHWLAASLSYSFNNNNFANVGLGLYIRGSIFQFFFITDNVLAPFYPEMTRNINYRMGCNLAFKCKEKDVKVMF